jgi:Zn-dependent oligopeptidase
MLKTFHDFEQLQNFNNLIKFIEMCKVELNSELNSKLNFELNSELTLKSIDQYLTKINNINSIINYSISASLFEKTQNNKLYDYEQFFNNLLIKFYQNNDVYKWLCNLKFNNLKFNNLEDQKLKDKICLNFEASGIKLNKNDKIKLQQISEQKNKLINDYKSK